MAVFKTTRNAKITKYRPASFAFSGYYNNALLIVINAKLIARDGQILLI